MRPQCCSRCQRRWFGRRRLHCLALQFTETLHGCVPGAQPSPCVLRFPLSLPHCVPTRLPTYVAAPLPVYPPSRYEGEFQAGFAHGLGQFTSESTGEVYIGEFFAGQRHGWVQRHGEREVTGGVGSGACAGRAGAGTGRGRRVGQGCRRPGPCERASVVPDGVDGCSVGMDAASAGTSLPHETCTHHRSCPLCRTWLPFAAPGSLSRPAPTPAACRRSVASSLHPHPPFLRPAAA